MTEYKNLSEAELQSVIENAAKALKEKKDSKRKEVIVQIKQLAVANDIHVIIQEEDKRSARKGIKVDPKYRNPDDPTQTWTGRGMPPKWMQALISSDHDKSEFEINKNP